MAGATAFSSGCLSLAALLSRVNCFAMDTGNGTGVPDGWRNAATYSGGRGRIFSLRDLSASRQSDESAAASPRRPTDRRAGRHCSSAYRTVRHSSHYMSEADHCRWNRYRAAEDAAREARYCDIAIFSCVVPIYRDMLVRLSEIISAKLASRLILYKLYNTPTA